MLGQHQRLNLAAAIVGATLSFAGGAVIAVGGTRVAALSAAGIVAFACSGFVLRRVVVEPRFALFVVGAGAVGLMSVNGLRFNANTTYSDVLLVVCAALIFLLTLLGGRVPRLPLWLFLGGGVILVSAVVVQLYPPRTVPFQAGTPGGGNTPAAVTAGITAAADEPNLVMASRFLIALIVAPAVVGLIATTWRQCRLLVTLWLGGVAISSAIGVLGALTPLDLQNTLTGIPRVYGDRAIGLTVHPVALGLTAALAFPVALSRMITPGRTLRYTPLTALYLLAVVMSGSRAPLILCGLGFVLVVASQSQARRQIIVVALITTPFLVVLWPRISHLPAFIRLEGGSGQTSTSGHVSAIADGLHVFASRPIGSGFQAIRSAHNVFLQLLDSGGPLALVGYAIVIGGAIRLGLWVYSRAPLSARPDVIGLLASIGVLLGEGLVGDSSFDRYLYLPVGLLIGMSFVAQRDPNRPTDFPVSAELTPMHLAGPLLHERDLTAR